MKEKKLNHPDSIAELREQFLSHYPLAGIGPSLVHQRADLVLRYEWYHLLSTPEEITLDRWVLLNTPSIDLEDRIEQLLLRAQTQVPLLPIDRKMLASKRLIRSSNN